MNPQMPSPFRSLCVALAALAHSAPAVAGEVDLEIVLAVDGSGSIDAAEYRLQLAGYADALRDPSVQAAATSGPLGRVAVAMMVWSDAAFRKFETDWFVIDSAQAADRYADIVEVFYHHSGRTYGMGGGGTGIGAGIAYALGMLEENGIAARRRTIDVSGDGIETKPWFRKAVELPEARAMADAAGVTVNGLAILADFDALDLYYEENVITGPGAFVIEANDFGDFAEAIRRKLWLEFMSPVAALPGSGSSSRPAQQHAGIRRSGGGGAMEEVEGEDRIARHPLAPQVHVPEVEERPRMP